MAEPLEKVGNSFGALRGWIKRHMEMQSNWQQAEYAVRQAKLQSKDVPDRYSRGRIAQLQMIADRASAAAIASARAMRAAIAQAHGNNPSLNDVNKSVGDTVRNQLKAGGLNPDELSMIFWSPSRQSYLLSFGDWVETSKDEREALARSVLGDGTQFADETEGGPNRSDDPYDWHTVTDSWGRDVMSSPPDGVNKSPHEIVADELAKAAVGKPHPHAGRPGHRGGSAKRAITESDLTDVEEADQEQAEAVEEGDIAAIMGSLQDRGFTDVSWDSSQVSEADAIESFGEVSKLLDVAHEFMPGLKLADMKISLHVIAPPGDDGIKAQYLLDSKRMEIVGSWGQKFMHEFGHAVDQHLGQELYESLPDDLKAKFYPSITLCDLSAGLMSLHDPRYQPSESLELSKNPGPNEFFQSAIRLLNSAFNTPTMEAVYDELENPGPDTNDAYLNYLADPSEIMARMLDEFVWLQSKEYDDLDPVAHSGAHWWPPTEFHEHLGESMAMFLAFTGLDPSTQSEKSLHEAVRKAFAGHKGRKGHRGGSLPREVIGEQLALPMDLAGAPATRSDIAIVPQPELVEPGPQQPDPDPERTHRERAAIDQWEGKMTHSPDFALADLAIDTFKAHGIDLAVDAGWMRQMRYTFEIANSNYVKGGLASLRTELLEFVKLAPGLDRLLKDSGLRVLVDGDYNHANAVYLTPPNAIVIGEFRGEAFAHELAHWLDAMVGGVAGTSDDNGATTTPRTPVGEIIKGISDSVLQSPEAVAWGQVGGDAPSVRPGAPPRKFSSYFTAPSEVFARMVDEYLYFHSDNYRQAVAVHMKPEFKDFKHLQEMEKWLPEDQFKQYAEPGLSKLFGRLQKALAKHDVSDEERDYRGRWTAGFEIPSTVQDRRHGAAVNMRTQFDRDWPQNYVKQTHISSVDWLADHFREKGFDIFFSRESITNKGEAAEMAGSLTKGLEEVTALFEAAPGFEKLIRENKIKIIFKEPYNRRNAQYHNAIKAIQIEREDGESLLHEMFHAVDAILGGADGQSDEMMDFFASAFPRTPDANLVYDVVKAVLQTPSGLSWKNDPGWGPFSDYLTRPTEVFARAMSQYFYENNPTIRHQVDVDYSWEDQSVPLYETHGWVAPSEFQAVKPVIERLLQRASKSLREAVRKSFEGHHGRQGKRGGSLPRGQSAQTAQVIPDDIRAMRFFHGTDSEEHGQSILKSGQIVPGNKTGHGFLTPVEGRLYLTTDPGYAGIYAMGGDIAGSTPPPSFISKDGPYGYIFEIDGKDLKDIQPDEDSVGEMLYDMYNHPEKKIPWAVAGRQTMLTENQRNKVKGGEYIYFAQVGKKLIKDMSDGEKMAVIRAGAHIAHLGPLPIKAAYRFDKTLTGQLHSSAEVLQRSEPVQIGDSGLAKSVYNALSKHHPGMHDQLKHGRRKLKGFPISPAIKSVADKLASHGFNLFVVGGALRDYFKGETPHDFDLATDARPNEVKLLFGKDVKPDLGGEEHGTVRVGHDGEIFEITTLRHDVTTDGRHATVSFTRDIREDLQRRDLTMNALAYEVKTGTLYGPGKDGSPAGALHDIKHGIVSFVGQKRHDKFRRIQEDRLRALRAVRFVVKTGGKLDKDSFFAIQEAVRQGLIPSSVLSGERVRDELLKTLSYPNGADGIRLWKDTGLLYAFFPELKAAENQAQNHHHGGVPVLEHIMRTVEAAKVPDGEMSYFKDLATAIGRSEPQAALAMLRLTMLTHDIGKPATAVEKPTAPGEFSFINHEDVGAGIADDIARRLVLPRHLADLMVTGVKEHMAVPAPDASESAIRRWGRKLREENKGWLDNGFDPVDWLMAIRNADWGSHGRNADDTGEERLRSVLAAVPVTTKPVISGNRIMQLTGLKPSREVGNIVRAVGEYLDAHPDASEDEIDQQVIAAHNEIKAGKLHASVRGILSG